jgi:hypothetical protein
MSNNNIKETTIDPSTLSTDELKQLYAHVLSNIGQLETNKTQMITSAMQLGILIRNRETAPTPKQEEIVLPKLKKLNLNFPQVFDK